MPTPKKKSAPKRPAEPPVATRSSKRTAATTTPSTSTAAQGDGARSPNRPVATSAVSRPHPAKAPKAPEKAGAIAAAELTRAAGLTADQPTPPVADAVGAGWAQSADR